MVETPLPSRTAPGHVVASRARYTQKVTSACLSGKISPSLTALLELAAALDIPGGARRSVRGILTKRT